MSGAKKRQKASSPDTAELTAIQSNLGFSYLHAVVSRAGGSCEETHRTADNMGIDIRLEFQGIFSPTPIFRSISIIGQLKTTRQVLRESAGRISYPLDSG